jgi:hypothetical protein
MAHLLTMNMLLVKKTLASSAQIVDTPPMANTDIAILAIVIVTTADMYALHTITAFLHPILMHGLVKYVLTVVLPPIGSMNMIMHAMLSVTIVDLFVMQTTTK